MAQIGILHPGDMGISIAASALHSRHKVYWASEGRSDKSHARAEKHHLTDAGTPGQLCKLCEIIISVCPPHAAEDTAKSVVEQNFKGLYLDANAISPQRAAKLGQMMESVGIPFVDGGIIGGPVWEPQSTWLYLSGKEANRIAALFSAGPLETKVIGTRIGKASALKMCYAAYSKGTTALLCAVLAAAEALHVRNELYQQWEFDNPGSSEQAARKACGVTAKAWRFEGEMEEIAATFHEAGLPDGFHAAAAEIYGRMAGFKGAEHVPGLNDVLQVLRRE